MMMIGLLRLRNLEWGFVFHDSLLNEISQHHHDITSNNFLFFFFSFFLFIGMATTDLLSPTTDSLIYAWPSHPQPHHPQLTLLYIYTYILQDNV